MKKKSLQSNSMEIKCAVCGKVTKHYISKSGEVRCLICGAVNKTVEPKKKLEVVFEADETFDNKLNPVKEEPVTEESMVAATITGPVIEEV